MLRAPLYSQRIVRCNTGQQLICLIWLPAKIRVSQPWQMLTVANDHLWSTEFVTCIHYKSSLDATSSRTYHLNIPLLASFSSYESKFLLSPTSLPPLLVLATLKQDLVHTIRSSICIPINKEVLDCYSSEYDINMSFQYTSLTSSHLTEIENTSVLGS